MSTPFLRFEDGKVTIGSRDLLVRSANLSISPSLQVERVYGELNKELLGASTDFVKFAPTAGIKGQLEINFLINSDTFSDENTNNISNLMTYMIILNSIYIPKSLEKIKEKNIK